jgi:enoyl-CoA hydratase/carnithine racemase
MSTLSMSSALLVVACTAGGAGVSWLATAMHFRLKLAAIGSQFELAERAKANAQELAKQSRQQVEQLQKALSEAKRDSAIDAAAQSARRVSAAAAAEKARVRAEVLRQLEAADASNDLAAHGFADTQPLATR